MNLIDTPGHVDFTIEVERSLRVLDGGVVVLDASAGVEAQTLTVWRQAAKNRVPRIAFINKMDKPNANFEASLESIRSKLGHEPLPLQLPLGTGRTFKGVVDLVTLQSLVWDRADSSGGKFFTSTPLHTDSAIYPDAMEARYRLIDHLCDADDGLASLVIESGSYANLPAESLHKAIRKFILSPEHASLLTMCGSAYKNIGVQPLLDAVVGLLPSPRDIRYPFLEHYSKSDLVALAFKIIHHPQKGVLTFVRIYSGKISQGDKIFNMSKASGEKVGRLMVAFADDFKDVKEIGPGGIAVISGLKETATGDTIVQGQGSGSAAMQ